MFSNLSSDDQADDRYIMLPLPSVIHKGSHATYM